MESMSILTMFKNKKSSLIYKFRDYFKKIKNSFLVGFFICWDCMYGFSMASVKYFL